MARTMDASVKVKLSKKKKYTAPTLTQFGKLTEITAGGSGFPAEGAGGGSGNNDPTRDVRG